MAMDMFTAGTTYSPYTGNTPITQIDTNITDMYDGAKNLQAQITRAQWEDYKLRYAPIMENLIDSVTGSNSSAMTQQVINNATSAVDSAYANARGTAQRMAGAYGLSIPQYSKTSSALDKAKEKVNAINQTRRAIGDRNMALATGLNLGGQT